MHGPVQFFPLLWVTTALSPRRIPSRACLEAPRLPSLLSYLHGLIQHPPKSIGAPPFTSIDTVAESKSGLWIMALF